LKRDRITRLIPIKFVVASEARAWQVKRIWSFRGSRCANSSIFFFFFFYREELRYTKYPIFSSITLLEKKYLGQP
jgi:hypothetical protein